MIGCSRPVEEKSTDWAKLALHGKSLDLIDDKGIESYRFHEDGIVVATFGTKGGPITAPLFYWKINGDCLTISEASDGKIFRELCSPSIQEDVIRAKRKDGSMAQYRLSNA